MTDDDRRLARRLADYESRVPDAAAPASVTMRGRLPWGMVAAIGAVAVIGVAVLAGNLLNDRGVGEADATPSPTPRASATRLATPTPSPTPGVTYDEVPSTPPTPTPTPFPTSPPNAGAPGVAWSTNAAHVDGLVSRITAEDGRFYALGSDGMTAVIWSSADGRSWRRSDLPRPASWADEYIGFNNAKHLASVGDRLVALGTIGIDDHLEAVAWASTDGFTWEEIDTGPFRTAAGNVWDLTNGPAGLVAISHRYEAGSGNAWQSTDGGETWTEHRPPGNAPTFRTAVGTSRGYLIGGGVNETFQAPPTPMIWYSNDAATWTPASVEGAGEAGIVTGLAINGSGTWVAIGTINDEPVAWRSIDRGLSWDLVATFGATGPSDLAGTPNGFVAVDTSNPGTTWTSADGITWSADSPVTFDPDPAKTIEWATGIGRIGDTLIFAGNTRGSDSQYEPDWRAWMGTLQP